MINTIYTITTMHEDFNHKHVIGWYAEIEDAKTSVEHNEFDMHETTNDYAVIEKCPEGIQICDDRDQYWYHFDRLLDKYVSVQQPTHFNGVINIGIG